MRPVVRLVPAVALTMTVASLAAPVRMAPVLVEREAFLMGTRLRVTVSAQSAKAGAVAIEAAFREVTRWELLLSSWRDDSELTRINSAPPDDPVTVPSDLFGLLQEVDFWAKQSDGAFDPAVGSLITAWDMRGEGRVPAAPKLAKALAASGAGAFRLESANRVTRLHDTSWMTAGAFGKGAALRAARAALGAAGVESASLDFGGQVLAMGSPPEDGAWVVGIAHPSRRHQTLGLIRLSNHSVATSAASERFVEIDGVRYGHILDPRSGWPVPAWGSVTVVAEDPLLADIASTTLFVMGPEEGMRWAEARQEIGVLFLRATEGEVEASWNPAMELWLVIDEVWPSSAQPGEQSPP